MPKSKAAWLILIAYLPLESVETATASLKAMQNVKNESALKFLKTRSMKGKGSGITPFFVRHPLQTEKAGRTLRTSSGPHLLPLLSLESALYKVELSTRQLPL